MKKSKIEAIDYRMLINNTLCDYLQEKAKEGWIFYSLYADQLHFKKEEPQSLKFQCDYQIHDYEYDHMIEDMGYQEVCHYQNMTIYKNHNINALDLHTDESVLSHVLKTHFIKQIKYHSLAFCLLILPVWFLFNYIFSFPLSLGSFFVNSSFFLLTLLLIFLSLCPLLSIIKYYYLYKMIDQKKEKYYPTYLQKVISILIYLLSFSLVIIVIEFIFVYFSFSHLLYILFIGGVPSIIIYFMKKREINKKLISFILILIYLITTSFSDYLPNEKQEQPSFKPYMINYTDYQKNKEIFVNKDEFNDYQTQDQDYANKKEVIEICVNHWIANKVMESEICFL